MRLPPNTLYQIAIELICRVRLSISLSCPLSSLSIYIAARLQASVIFALITDFMSRHLSLHLNRHRKRTKTLLRRYIKQVELIIKYIEKEGRKS